MANRQIGTIVVDLTPVLPGGENGGAKIFVTELLLRFAALHPETQFVLLTQYASHQELKAMECRNVRCRMVIGPPEDDVFWLRFFKLATRLSPYLPARVRAILNRLGCRLHAAKKRNGSHDLLQEIGADLLFCPFTAPTYFEPGIPVVCTIYDLQYKTYPEFFESADVAYREQVFIEACNRATVLAAISEYSRESAIRHGNLDPNRIRTIYLRMAQRITAQPDESPKLLASLGLVAGRYLIYPANFWRHKNHEMLITAFGMACNAMLDADIKLVCSGAPGKRQGYLAQAATAMGLRDRIVFPGYLPSEGFAALLAEAGGMVFPSLYEGFGLPVIEAMAAGIPVACSNMTSLPEVAGDAVIYFDPRVTSQIADAIMALLEDESTRSRLINAGYRRAVEYADSSRMAQEYWELFLDAVNNQPRAVLLSGVYEDDWCGPQLRLQVPPLSAARMLEMELSAPAWLPAPKMRILAKVNGKALSDVFEIMRGDEGLVSLPLAAGAEMLVLQITPSFVPAKHGIGDDVRDLSLILKRCALQAPDGATQLIYPDSSSSGVISKVEYE